jgi:hypothetical protein
MGDMLALQRCHNDPRVSAGRKLLHHAYQRVHADSHWCWLTQGKQEVERNLLREQGWNAKAERVLKRAAQGPDCWDCKMYLAYNPDLSELSCHDAFSHFVSFGQFDPSRAFRCAPLLQEDVCVDEG